MCGLRCLTPAVIPRSADLDRVAATAAELFGYFTDLIERRRTEPGENTISDLVRLMDGDSTGARHLAFASRAERAARGDRPGYAVIRGG
jgi:cytochrome P450